MAENRVIGNQNTIPWHLPEDFKWFKNTTMGATLLMGRKTFESIGRPLPGRQTIILSRSQFSIPNTVTVQTIDSIETVATSDTIWVAGGAEIYQLMLPKCSDLYITRVHQKPDGDTFFPKFEDSFTLDTVLESNTQFSIEHWKKS
ncbi:MAG: dihydrofolate reductase [Coraliomargaritaceae bacterium]